MKLNHLHSAQTLVYIGGVVALSLIAGVTLFTLRSEYQRTASEVIASSERAAHQLAIRTTEVFDRVNQATLLIKHLHGRGSLESLHDLRSSGGVADDLTQFVYIADRRGFVLDGTFDMLAANVADEDFFKMHLRQSDLDVLISPVLENSVSHKFGIPMTRRLGAGEGFEGIVVASVDPAALSSPFGQAEAKGTAVGVVGQDGIFLSRFLDGKLTFGDRINASDLAARARQVKATGEPIVSRVDGKRRFLAVSPVQKYPLYSVIGIDADLALQGYNRIKRRILLWALLVSVAAIGAGALLLSQARRLDLSRARTRTAEANFRATLDGSLDAVTILEAVRPADGGAVDFRIVDCNEPACRIVQRRRPELIGSLLSSVAPSIRDDGLYASFERVIRNGLPLQAEVQATHGSVSVRWLHHQVVPLEDGVALITRDVSEQKHAEEALERLTLSDGLTGLANRRGFDQALITARSRAVRHGWLMALAYIDLDGFKAINDTHGHAAGDQVLVEVSRRLREAVRDTDTVSRLGGDEFALILENVGSHESLAALCDRLLMSLREPHVIDGTAMSATPSIGCILACDNETSDQACRRADAAMYTAKQAGKSRCHLVSEARELLPVTA